MGVALAEPLPEIPVYNVGANYPLELARLVGERGYELLAVATKGVPRPALRIADAASRRWLERNKSPYLDEIRYLAEQSREPGLYYLNVSYDWHGGHYKAFENDARRAAMQRVQGQWDLDWVRWPLLNRETKLAIVAEPANGRLMAQGFEDQKPATGVLDVTVPPN